MSKWTINQTLVSNGSTDLDFICNLATLDTIHATSTSPHESKPLDSQGVSLQAFILHPQVQVTVICSQKPQLYFKATITHTNKIDLDVMRLLHWKQT